MNFILASSIYAAILFAGMIAFGELGWRIAKKRAARDPEGAWHGIGVVDGAVFALLGLLIAFTFSGAVSRFDQRRDLIVEEINAIGTAYLRIDLLSQESQPDLRQAFRRYLDSRIAAYELLPDVDAAEREVENSNRIEGEIWELALAAARGSQPATMLLTPALNDMFDIATTRTLAARQHPPNLIFYMMFGLSLIAAALAGYEMARANARSLLHVIAFAALTTIVFFVILELEYPRKGLIRLSAFDASLVELRAGME